MQKVFLVGCARSGTSWLQIILAAHDGVASVRETHVFDGYLSHLYKAWDAEASSTSKDGLRLLLGLDDIDAVARSLVDKVFDRIAASKPGASIALEKTPPHLFFHAVIRRLYPDARFINIVRDPRAVVASLLAARKEPWGGWAPAQVFDAARLWHMSVRIGTQDLARYGDDVFQLRYEDLHATPDETLDRLWHWLGVTPQPYDRERFSIFRLKSERNKGPMVSPTWDGRENFFRRGQIDSWREELSERDIATIESVVKPYLVQLGYTPYERPPLPTLDLPGITL